MNKKVIICGFMALAAMSASMTSCKYDDDDLWANVDDLKDRVTSLEEKANAANSDIQALQAIVGALQNKLTITKVEPVENGYKIVFSDGQTAVITNGVNGKTPVISVEKGSDGLYYWTLDGELLKDAQGNPVCANGIKGDTGAAAVAPQVRINPTTKEWEISIDGGTTWTSTGVVAEGTSDKSIFASVDVTQADYITFVLADGTEFKVPRYDESAPLFAVAGAQGEQQFFAGETIVYTVDAKNVADYSIAKPDGWSVRYADSKLSITAPVTANTYAEKEGVVAVNLVSANGKSLIAKIDVIVYEIKTLTFEDADAKFPAYTLAYCGKTITTWSSLIEDSKQYGGPLLYGDDGMGMDEPYYWYDKGNTELKHSMPEAWGMYAYWSGGHAISNYISTDLTKGDFNHQLMVYGVGGHNGSANFAMHYGYKDNSPYCTENLPAIEFGDGKERVIDHMWVMNSLYAMNCYVSGNGLTAKIGPDDWVKLVATGFNAAGTKVGEVSIYMCNGPENIVRDWTKWDLSGLGKVAKVEFNVTGSSDNGAGFSQPAYFAYDDVAVRFTE